MNLSFKIARRYFFSRKKGGGLNLISIISGISLLGYVVGTAALIIVLSVFNGFEQLFTSMYANFDSDLKIVSTEGKTFRVNEPLQQTLKTTDGVEAWSKVIEENVLLRYQNQQAIATIKGVDEQYVTVTHFDSAIVSGYVDVRHDSLFAVVGQGVAYRLSVDPNDVFKALAIYVPKKDVQSIINPDDAFNKTLIYPSGVFAVQDEVDHKYVICPYAFVANLLERENEVSSIDIKLNQSKGAEPVKARLKEQLGDGFNVKTRFEQRDSFFKVMRSEKAVSYLILLFILFIAASNTISSLYILSLEKQRDMYVLKSLGLNPQTAANIFVVEGLFVAFVGGGLGLLLGLTLCYLQQSYGLIALQDAADVMFSAYPVQVKIFDVLLVSATVMVLGYITTLYPASRVKKLMQE